MDKLLTDDIRDLDKDELTVKIESIREAITEHQSAHMA